MGDYDSRIGQRPHSERLLEQYEKYPDDYIENATVRPEKYHVLEQEEYDDCIITKFHQIINSDYLDVERELINGKLMNSENYESRVFSKYGLSPDKKGGDPREKTYIEAGEENSEDEFDECLEECEEETESEELDSEDEMYDEDDNSRELLMLLKSRGKSRRIQKRETLSLPSSEFLVIREFPISFGIPVITLQKLNVRPILFLWLFLLISMVYTISIFLDEYIINDIIPLYPLGNIFEPKSEQTEGLVPSLLRSKNPTVASRTAGGDMGLMGRSNLLKKLFPLFNTKQDSEVSEGAINRPLNVTLDIKHCHIQFLNSSSDLSYIKVRSWRLFSKSHMYSGSSGRYRIPSRKKDKFEYICSHGTLFWLLKRYILPWEAYSNFKIKSISWKDYKEYCDSSPRPWNFINDSNLSVKLHQSNTGDYFQCSINFFLANNFQFDELSVKFVPSSTYMRASSSIPIRAKSVFHLEALHGTFDLKDVHSPNISLTISDGWASIDLPTLKDSGRRNVFIESRGAPIYINSRTPIVVTMPVRIAELAVLRAENVKVQLESKSNGLGGHGYYKTASVVATLNPDSSYLENKLTDSLINTRINIQGSIPPVYVNVYSNFDSSSDSKNFSDELITWAGRHQWKDPHLLSFSKARFGGFSKWLQEDLASPWVLYINILGNREYPRGTWKAVSSRAFIRDPYALVLLSGGLLMPRIYTLFIHILGLKCMVPVSHSDLEDLDVINVDDNSPNPGDNNGEMSGINTNVSSESVSKDMVGVVDGIIHRSSDDELKEQVKGGILANMTSRISKMIGPEESKFHAGDKNRQESKLTDWKRIFGIRSGPRLLSNNLQESIYFDEGVTEDYYINQNSNIHEDVANIKSISDVGNYMGKSSRISACESSITENIFSVINTAIIGTAQQPSVIVWTQNEDEEMKTYSPGLDLGERNKVKIFKKDLFSITKWVIRKLKSQIRRAFKLVSSMISFLESTIFPGWLIPGWSKLSKKILKSSMLADDDFVSNPEVLSDNPYQTIEQYIFTAENDAILKDLVTANDLQGYIVSLSLNILCAILVAAAAMWVLYYYVFPWFLTGIREMQLVSTASHRLNHDFRTSEAAEWIVMVSTIQWPSFGLLLRWNQRQKRRDNEKLCIYIKQVENLSQNSGNSSSSITEEGASGSGLSEFFLYIPANEASLTTHLGRNQQELFVPMKYTDKCIFEVTMPYELISDQKYRLRILRISSSGHIIEQSNWSNEIIPGNKMKFVDFPLLFLRRFLPKKRSSLNLFIDKNTDHYSPFGIPFYFRDIEIIIFDVLGGKKKKPNNISQEEIFDYGFENDEGDKNNLKNSENNNMGILGKSDTTNPAHNDQLNSSQKIDGVTTDINGEQKFERSFSNQSLNRESRAKNQISGIGGGLHGVHMNARNNGSVACGGKDVSGGMPSNLDSVTGIGYGYSEVRGNRKYVLVARLVRDFPGTFAAGEMSSGVSGDTGKISENYTSGGAVREGRSAARFGSLHASSVAEEDDEFASLRSYTFKNKSFDTDKVRIEGYLENINLFGNYNENMNALDRREFGGGNNVYILRNKVKHGSRGESRRLSIGGFGRDEKVGNSGSVASSLYLEQSLISQKRILFELQEADSGQVVANGDVKCSKLIEIAWKSLVNDSSGEDSFEEDFLAMHERDHDDVVHGRRVHSKMGYHSEIQENDVIQVHDTISNDTVSINKFVDISIKLYYVEGGQWGELSMLLDRSFWVQYLRHDLSEEIIIDSNPLSNVESIDIEMVTKKSDENSSRFIYNHSTNSIINRQKTGAGLNNESVNSEQNKEAKGSSNSSSSSNSNKPRFINDTPGRIIINGSDTQLTWIWRELKKDSSSYIPKKLHLHLFDHYTDTHLSSLHGEKSIPNTGTFAWSVDVPFISQRSSSRDVYLVMAVSKDDIPSNVTIQGKIFVPRGSVAQDNTGYFFGGSGGAGVGAGRRSSLSNKQIIVAVSNSFKVIRLTTLSEFELLYATFCRTFGLEMEVVTYNDLNKYGFLVSPNSLRVCENIRKPIPTETHQRGTYCPGQFMISAKALAVTTGSRYALRGEDKELENCIYLKSRRKSIDIIENCTLNYSTYWWSSSPDRFLLKNGIILDTSIFLPLTIKVISCFKIDSIMLFLRNLSISKVFNSLFSFSSNLKCLICFKKGDYDSSQDNEDVKTINISSGLLVHSNYSTVFRRKSTWRSSKFRSWKAILSLIYNSKESSKQQKLKDKERKSISKSKQRWSKALMSLKVAQLKRSSTNLIRNLKNSISNNQIIDGSINSMRNSNCEYTELATISNWDKVGEAEKLVDTQLDDEVLRRGSGAEEAFSGINETNSEKLYRISGYNIGYGGILVPIYIAKIKQRQELIHEIWYSFQFSILPMILNIMIYGFQISLLSIFPVTCIVLTLVYNYLSTLSISNPHSHISPSYFSDIVYNPTWDFFMSLPFPVPYLLILSVLHLIIIHTTFIASSSSPSYNKRQEDENNEESGLAGSGLISRWRRNLRHYWINLLLLFEEIGMFVTLFSMFLTLLAISMFLLWFLLGSLINSDNILPYVVMLLALGFVIVSLWNNFSSSRGIVDRFIAENLQSLISIALGHWFEATNQTFTSNSNSADPNDLRAAASEQLHCEISNHKYLWAKSILNNMGKQQIFRDKGGIEGSSGLNSNNKQTLKDFLDGSMELKHSTRIKSFGSKLPISDYCSLYCSKWEYLKILPAVPKSLFGINSKGEIVGVQETLRMYYGMKLATVKDVISENDKVDGLLEGFDVALLQDGVKYGPRFGYKVEDFLQLETWYKCAIVKVPIFPPSEALSDEAKVKLIFDFFDMDEDGFLNKEEFLYWVINLHYDRFLLNGLNTKYQDIIDHFNSICNTNVDDQHGFSVEDIIILYSLYPGNLDSDYEKVIPIRGGTSENEGEMMMMSQAYDQFVTDRGLVDDKGAQENGGIDEEEYDDEFSEDIFTISSIRGVKAGSKSMIDQKGYLWIDLLSSSYEDSDKNTGNHFHFGKVVNDSDIGVITGDLSNLKLCSLNHSGRSSSGTFEGIGNSVGGLSIRGKSSNNIGSNLKGGVSNSSKHTKFQLLREVNVQKLKYIFTFATRNLRTPDIDTALRDIHSLAYKVFDAQVALLIPIFGRRNVLTFGNSHSLINDEFSSIGGGNVISKNASYEDYTLSGSLSMFDKQGNNFNSIGRTGLSNRNFSSSSSSWVLNQSNSNLNNNSSSSFINAASTSNIISNIGGIGGVNATISGNGLKSNVTGGDPVCIRNLASQNKNSENDTTKFLQLMRILHNEIRQDIWILFNHIIGRLFDKSRVKKGADHFLDIVYPKLIRRKAARIVNIFYGPSLNELSLSIHEYFVSAPPKTAAQVVDALKEYRVENQRNVKDTLEIISLSQGNASLQFQVSLITKALYALSVLKDTDVEMLTVDIPWKRSHTLITEEVLILPRNHQGMKVILGAIQTVLRRANSITSSRSGGALISDFCSNGQSISSVGKNKNNVNTIHQREVKSSVEVFHSALVDSKMSEINGILIGGGATGNGDTDGGTGGVVNSSSSTNTSEFSETTLEQVIQVIVSKYLWMDAFIFLIRLCGINLSTDRLPSVIYDNSVSLTNLNYIEERNLQHVKSVFTKLSNGSGFLPVELSDLALQTLTERCLNFSGLLVSMHFLGLISNNMLLMGSGNPLERLSELGLGQNINVFHIHKSTNFDNIISNSMNGGIAGGTFLNNQVNLFGASMNDKLLGRGGDHGIGNLDDIGFGLQGLAGGATGERGDLPFSGSSFGGGVTTLENGFLNKMTPERCSNYGELLDWTLLSNVKGIPEDVVKDFHKIAVLRCGFIGRSQLHEYIKDHKRLYIHKTDQSQLESLNKSYISNRANIGEVEQGKLLFYSRSQSNNFSQLNNNNIENSNEADNIQGGFGVTSSNKKMINKNQDDYFEKMTGNSSKMVDFNISFDIFDTALTTLGFSSHKLQSYILWLLLCLNLNMGTVKPFVNASFARDFIIMVYLQPIYKNNGEDEYLSGRRMNNVGGNNPNGNNHNNGNKASNNNSNNNSVNNTAYGGTGFFRGVGMTISGSNMVSGTFKSSLYEVTGQNKQHFDAQDVQSYRGYFTHEMLRRFLALAKITIPNSGVESIWKSLPKDPLNITPFIVPFRNYEKSMGRGGEGDDYHNFTDKDDDFSSRGVVEDGTNNYLSVRRSNNGEEHYLDEDEDYGRKEYDDEQIINREESFGGSHNSNAFEYEIYGEGVSGKDKIACENKYKLKSGYPIESELGSSSRKKFSRRISLGGRFKKEKKVGNNLINKFEDSMENIESYIKKSKIRNNLKESVHLRILMDPTGMDPMEGVVINIDSVRRLLPKKLMTGLWPEAIKVVLNIGLHLEKPDSAIIEATSKCLEYSNKYGLIRPGDMVSILAALSKEGLSFDLLCELLSNMRIQLPVREVKRMFDLMDLNQDKSLDLQELLDGFEVLFGLFLPQLVHDHVGLSYERQGLIIMATSASLLLFCIFVGIAIKTFEGMRNELSTAVQSVLAIVGAVGLQTGASQDSKEIEERMKERIEDIMGGDIETSMSQIELGEDSQYSSNSENIIVLREKKSSSRIISKNNYNRGGVGGVGGVGGTPSGLIIITEKGPILKIGYSLPSRFRSDINDPRPCITFYSQDQVNLEPIFYCTKGIINQQHNLFIEDDVSKRWCIKPALPKYTGLTFSTETGIIYGTIPTHTQNKIGYIRRVSTTLENDERHSSLIKNSAINMNDGANHIIINEVGGTGSNSNNNGIGISTGISTGMHKFQKKLLNNNKGSLNESDTGSGGLGGVGVGADGLGTGNVTRLEGDILAKELLKNSRYREDVVMPYGGQLVQMNRKTFTIYCIISELDEKVVFKTRVTFQIVPRTRTQKS
ncbi:EF hand family [Cryptosporidium sp. chipmunk genotype I]|uniref:EF hand family n=1 Tax=Cryptosporidium sp. chipmunk genotype I TaxID=1280935 RepID=UPI003519FD82|nr:EF hand family [Cryptosporidium sp. chipmunk genotype I]